MKSNNKEADTKSENFIICTLITYIFIVCEKENVTVDLHLTSSARPIMMIGAKVVPYFVCRALTLRKLQ